MKKVIKNYRVFLAAAVFLITAFFLYEQFAGQETVTISQDDSELEKEKQPEKESQSERKYTKLVMAIPYSGVEKEDISLVEEEINKICRKKLQAEIEITTADNYYNQVNLMLAGEEQLDIMYATNEMLMESYINNYLLPLDELLEQYGQDIISEVGENIVHAGNINQTLYGIPSNRDYAQGSDAYMLRKDILEKYDINSDEIKTHEDLEKVFAIIKKKEKDMTVLASGGDVMLGQLYFIDGSIYNNLGRHMNYGRDEKIVNTFKTKEYMDALKMVRNWYLKGYLDTDSISETESLFTRVKKGKVFAYTTIGKPGIVSQDCSATGQDMVCVQLGKDVIPNNSIAYCSYAITSNTVSAKKSMKLLNLIYSDPDIMNLLCYGVEGIHYKKTEDGHITYADRERGNPFASNAWKMPNQFITYVWEGNPLSLWDDVKKFNEDAIHCCDLGLNYDLSSVYTQYSALKDIYSQYRLVLENGLVNPEEGLKHMLEEFDENGMDSIIALRQQQYDSWKINKKYSYEPLYKKLSR